MTAKRVMTNVLVLLFALCAGAGMAAAAFEATGNAVSFTSYSYQPEGQDWRYEITGSNWTELNDTGVLSYDNYIIIGSDQGYDVQRLVDTPEKRLATATMILRYAEWFDPKIACTHNLTMLQTELADISQEYGTRIVISANNMDEDLEQTNGTFDRLYFGDGFLLGANNGTGIVTLTMTEESDFILSADNRSDLANATNAFALQNGFKARPDLEPMIWFQAERLSALAEDTYYEPISMEDATRVRELNIQFDQSLFF